LSVEKIGYAIASSFYERMRFSGTAIASKGKGLKNSYMRLIFTKSRGL
jgi:hypothetical protein